MGDTGSFAPGFNNAGVVLAVGILSCVFVLGDVTPIVRHVPGEVGAPPPERRGEPPLDRSLQDREPSPA